MALHRLFVRRLFLEAFPRMGAPRSGLKWYRRLVRKHSYKGLERAIRLSSKLGDSEMLQHFGKVSVKLRPKHPSGYWAVAEAHALAGDYFAALRALKMAPSHPRTRALVFNIQARQAGAANLLVKGELSLDEKVTISKKSLGRNPLDWSSWHNLVSSLVSLNRVDEARDVLKGAPYDMRNQLDYFVLSADTFEKAGDQASQLACLLEAQKFFPGESSILLRLAKIYADNNQDELAHVFMRAARNINVKYGTVRLFTFETTVGYLDDARETLQEISRFDDKTLARYLPNWNRLSPIFPEKAEEFKKWRKQSRSLFQKKKPTNSRDLDSAVALGVKSRWIDETFELVERCAAIGVVPSLETSQWLSTVRTNLGKLEEYLELCALNEDGPEVVGLRRGIPISLSEQKIPDEDLVEFFIPPVFFAFPFEEKPSFGTIRAFARQAAEILMESDAVVVFRHQLNWRFARRRLTCRAISYHTAERGVAGRLHYQEAPLAGRCTVDREGFAGFSEIAHNFTLVDDGVEGIDLADLQATHQAMVREYIDGNVSKYTQSASDDMVLPEKYVFVPMQIPTDVVAELAHITGVEMLRTIASHYEGTDTKVVVKRHPYCNSLAVQSEIARLAGEGKVIVSKGSIHQLISGSEAVFCINSGVGLEALMHMKPVVVSGNCDYAYAVSHEATSVEDLRSYLGQGKIVFDELRALKFLHYYYHNQTIAPVREEIERQLVHHGIIPRPADLDSADGPRQVA